MDTLGIERATLAGFSAGGGKITRFARLYPSRVQRLVYFDTIYSFTAPGLEERMGAAIIERVGGRPKDSVDLFRAYNRAWELGAWSPALDANLNATYTVAADGTIKSRSAAGWLPAFRADIEAGLYYETKISHPALMFFATNLDQERLRQFDEATQEQLLPLAEETDRKRFEQIEEFRKNGEHVRVVEMPRTAHYCFIQRPREIIRVMRQFLSEPAQ